MDLVTFGKITGEIQQTTQETQKVVMALNDDSNRVKELANIRDTLSVPSTVHLDTRTTQTCTELSSRCVSNTGSWIWGHEAFSLWTSNRGNNVLVVFGAQSSGKTSLCALVTKRLEEQRNRTFVGHYFFPPSTKKSDDNKNSVQSCLKYVAFQIARVGAVVRKALNNTCNHSPAVFRPSESSELSALWSSFNIGKSGSSTTYYIVLDGIENLPEKQCGTLLRFVFDPQRKKESAGHVRILVSGFEQLFTAYQYANGTGWIRMEDYNQDDMRTVVQETLDKQGILQHARPDSAQEKSQEKARIKIIKKILQRVNGSYSLLKNALDAVTGKLETRPPLEDLDRILEESTSSQKPTIKDVEPLLTADEIAELNELLK